MNESTSSTVLADQTDVLVDPDSGAAVDVDPATPVTGELVEVENFLTKPFDTYNTTEGLLLILVILVFLCMCAKFLTEGFYWL